MPNYPQIGRLPFLCQQDGYYPPSPKAFNEEYNIIRYLVRKNAVNIDIGELVRKKTLKVVMRAITILPPPSRRYKRKKIEDN